MVAPESGNVGELHLFVGRTWHGPDGKTIDLTRAVFEEMIRNFDARDSKTLGIDYDHRSWNRQNPDSRAAGWIMGLFIRDGELGPELWAKVEWTNRAADDIRAGEWRFCSPSFDLLSKSSVTGEEIGAELLNVAVTNNPAQDGLQPIKLSLAEAGGNREETVHMAEDATADDKAAAGDKSADDNDAINKMGALLDRWAESQGLDRLAVLTMLTEKADEIGKMLGMAADRDGTPAEENMSKTTEDKGVDEARVLATQVGALTAQLSKLSDQVTSLSKSAADRDAADAKAREAAIASEADAIIADGRAMPDQRDNVIYVLTNAPERAASMFGRKVAPIGERRAGPEHMQRSAPEKIEGLDVSDLAPHERELVRGFIGMGMPAEKAKAHLMKNRDELAKRAARVGLA